MIIFLPCEEKEAGNIQMSIRKERHRYNVIDEDVVKTISYDDKYLRLTYKEKLFFDEILKESKYVIIFFV